MNKDLEYLGQNFEYVSDGKLDNWRIMPMDNLKGDCDDFAVTALYLACDRSLVKFWFMILTFQALLWHMRSPAGGGHLVLWLRGHGYIDNWDCQWVTKEYLLEQGYKFRFPFIFPFCAMKMFFGVVLRLFK